MAENTTNDVITDSDEIEETSNDVEESDDIVEFDDGSVDGSREQDSSTQVSKKRQSKEENHKYAEMRRNKELEDSYKKGLMEGIGGVNPYTHEKIEDDDDIEQYKQMKEIEKRGGDPVEDFAKYSKIFIKEKRQQEEKLNAESMQKEQSIKDSLKAFNDKYPDVEVKSLLENEDFKEFAMPSINRGETIVEAYERWIKFSAKLNSQIEDKARKNAAKKMSSPGSLTADAETPPLKSVSQMTDKEFKEYKKRLGL